MPSIECYRPKLYNTSHMSPESGNRPKRINIDIQDPEVITGVRTQYERVAFALANIGQEIRVSNLCEVLKNITHQGRSVYGVVYSLMDYGFISYTKKPKGTISYSRFVSKDAAYAIAVATLTNLQHREEHGTSIPYNERFYSGVKKILETINPDIAQAIKVDKERIHRAKKQPKTPAYVAEVLEGLNNSIIDRSRRRKIEESKVEVTEPSIDIPQPQVYTAKTVAEILESIEKLKFSGLETFEGVRSKLFSAGVTDDLIKQAIEFDDPKARWRLVIGQDMSIRKFNSYLEKLRDSLPQS